MAMKAALCSLTLVIRCLLQPKLSLGSVQKNDKHQRQAVADWNRRGPLLGKEGRGANRCESIWQKRNRNSQGFILCSALLIIHVFILCREHVITNIDLPPSHCPGLLWDHHTSSLLIPHCVIYGFDKWKFNIADSTASAEKYSAAQTCRPTWALRIWPLSHFTGEKPDCWYYVNTDSGGCMWAHTALQDGTNNPDLQTQKRGSRLSRITVFTSGPFSSKPVLFYRNRGEEGGVGGFKHFCICRYAQECAALSLAGCSLWHSSELLKALPCPLLLLSPLRSLKTHPPTPPTFPQNIVCSSWRSTHDA